MKYKLTKDFSGWNKGDVLINTEWPRYARKSGTFLWEHIDTIKALPEIYEPVEETPEWTGKLYEIFVGELQPVSCKCKSITFKDWMKHCEDSFSQKDFAKVILDNMPKQERITANEIDDFQRIMEQYSPFHYSATGFTKQFLKSKWLLEE